MCKNRGIGKGPNERGKDKNLTAALEQLEAVAADDRVQVWYQIGDGSIVEAPEWYSADEAAMGVHAVHNVAADCGMEVTFTLRSWKEVVAAEERDRAQRQATESRERAQYWAAKEAEWAAQGMRSCGRCGGAGGSQAWPGYVCYGCQGRGCVPAKGVKA